MHYLVHPVYKICAASKLGQDRVSLKANGAPAVGQHQQQSNRSNGHDDNEGDHHQNDDYVQWTQP